MHFYIVKKHMPITMQYHVGSDLRNSLSALYHFIVSCIYVLVVKFVDSFVTDLVISLVLKLHCSIFY